MVNIFESVPPTSTTSTKNIFKTGGTAKVMPASPQFVFKNSLKGYNEALGITKRSPSKNRFEMANLQNSGSRVNVGSYATSNRYDV